MTLDSVSERFRLARKVLSVKQNVAEAVSDEFFRDHPEWAERYGDRGRQFCTADACFHMQFLAGAIEAGSPEAFGAYGRWTASMLAARGIAAHTLDENLKQLEEHLSVALLPNEHQAVSTFLARGREACPEPEPACPAQLAGDRLGPARQVFLSAILSGQRQAAVTVVEEVLRAGHSHLDVYADVFTTSLHRVGELWQLNQISVAQEHMATSIVQYAVAAIYPRMVRSPVDRGSMIVTGVAGEMHQIGANLVADAMEASGWKVRFLGTNLPDSAILSAVEEISADVLCISTTLVANLPSVTELVRSVRDKLRERAPRIVLGGAAYRLATQFAQEIGAAGAFTDLRPALATFCG